MDKPWPLKWLLADRREPFTDPLCGGCLYAHIAYARQRAIKSEIIADALGRIGRIVWPSPIVVAASPEEGYRMRARLHVRGRRIGFFREGSHDLCDARLTRQLLPATSDVLDRIGAGLASLNLDVDGDLDVSENVDASQRVVHFETSAHLAPDTPPTPLEAASRRSASVGSWAEEGPPRP